jgi:hypothetical protein
MAAMAPPFADSPPSVVDIAFNCTPLRSIARLDIPLDASEAGSARGQRIKAAIAAFGLERGYYLSDARCVFRFANSEVDGVCRFEFEGAVRTDAGDRMCDQTLLDVRLVSETCGGVPPEVERWLAERVRHAVAIEFARFLAAAQAESSPGPHGEAAAPGSATEPGSLGL